MKRSRVPAACAAAAVAVVLPASLAVGSASAQTADAAAATTASSAKVNVWTSPVSVGDAPAGVQNGIVTRVGLTANGKGTVAWNAGGTDPSIVARDFTVSGVLSAGVSIGTGNIVSSVARDTAGDAAVSGQTAGSPAFSWVATRKAATGSSWKMTTVQSGTSVAVPAAFGLKSGFLVAATNSFIPTSTDQGAPTAAAYGFTPDGASIALGKGLTGVETGDFSHGGDGSNWAVTSTGHAITTGQRETTKPSKGKAGKSVAAVIRVGAKPTRNSLLGATRFGAGAVTTTGKSIAIAGLDVQQTNEIAARGIPVVALGEEGSIGESVEIGGVPDRRALEVDVAGRVGGGAVVTWLQQTSSRAESLLGQPKWAIVDADGDVESRGSFSSATDARDLRVVRVGTAAVAVWIRGLGDKSKFSAAKITDDATSLIKAPTGTPVGRLEGSLNTSQLTSNGRQVALSFVDAATHTVRVAVQTVK
jgi:hypothetical protein